MRRSLLSSCCVLLVASALPCPVEAGGFAVGGQGAKASGMAGAFTATSDDPSAVFYNTAGIARLDGLRLMAGATALSSKISFAGEDGAEAETANPMSVIPNAFLTYQLTAGATVGLGLTMPFAGQSRWPDDSPGRFALQEQRLQTFFISPVAGLDASTYLPGLRVGAGLDLVPARLYLRRAVDITEDGGELRFRASAFGAGARIGALYEPSALPGLALGLCWRSGVKLGFKGTADFDALGRTPRSTLPPDGTARTVVRLPQSLSLGVAHVLFNFASLALDATWTDWSSYHRLLTQFADGSTSTTDKSWHDTIALRAGIDLRLGIVSIRGGYAWDQSPVPAKRLDFSLPDASRHLVAAGAGLALPGGLTLDVGGTLVLPFQRDTGAATLEPAIKGTYKGSAWLVSADLGFAFGSGAEVKPQEPDRVGADASRSE